MMSDTSTKDRNIISMKKEEQKNLLLRMFNIYGSRKVILSEQVMQEVANKIFTIIETQNTE